MAYVQATALGTVALLVLLGLPNRTLIELGMPGAMVAWGGLLGSVATQYQAAGGSGISTWAMMLLIPTVVVVVVVLVAVWLVRRKARE